MLRLERRAIHPRDEEDLRPQGVAHCQAPAVVLLDAALDTPVRAGEDDLDRFVGQARLLEHAGQ